MTEEEKTPDVPECGRRLRRTREQLGLSVDDIASELRLSGFQIRALENDDWDHLPGTTYARGYLRSYARLLGLDPDQLLAGASTEEIEISRTEPAIDNRAAPSSERVSASPDRPSSGVPWRWVVAVVVLCAVVVVIWQTPLGRQLTAELGTLQGPSSDTGQQQAGAGGVARTDGGQMSVAAGEVAPEADVDAATGGQDGASGTGGDALNQPAMPTEPGRIVFQFDQRSWVDVRDARGKRLLYRTFRAGRRIEVEGQPPFRIYLGNAGGVRVEYLGEAISPKVVSGRLFARFVLGEPTG